MIFIKIWDKISKKTTEEIGRILPDKTDIELKKIEYGISVFLYNLYKFPIVFFVAYLFGVLNLAIISFFVFAAVRMFAGGLHGRTSLECLIISTIAFVALPLLSKHVELNIYLKIIIIVVSFLLFVLYAPADTEAKPFISKSFRKKMKRNTLIVSSIMTLIGFILKDSTLSNIIFYSMFIEALNITPIAYKILKRGYRNYEKYEN